MATTTTTNPTARILSARACVGHIGDEAWAIRTICAQSRRDIHPTEVTILRPVAHDRVRYVLAAGEILGSYAVTMAEEQPNAVVVYGVPCEERIVLPAIPGHAHAIGADGQPTCGCAYQAGKGLA